MNTNTKLLITCLVILIAILAFLVAALVVYLNKKRSFSSRTGWSRVLYKDSKNNKIRKDDVVNFITAFATTLSKLSNDKVGAIIVLENVDNLEKYVQIGNKVDSPFLAEFVYSIFYNHSSALHDGAMIIRNFRIASISSYLPVTKRLLSIKYGARHRAAFGISERTDAIAFVVSETTGTISCMYGDSMKTLASDSVKLATQIVDILFDNYAPLLNNRDPEFIKQIKERMN